jgi:polysaccharide biosynthesis protein PslH
MKTINIFSLRPPYLIGKGDQIVLYQRCIQLSSIENIDKINVYVASKNPSNEINLPKKVQIIYLSSKFLERFLMFIPLLMQNLPIQCSIYYNKQMKLAFCAQGKSDVSIIMTSRLAYLMKYHITPKQIIDMIDPLSQTYADLSRNTNNIIKKLLFKFEAIQLVKLEKRLTVTCKINTFVSAVDSRLAHLNSENTYSVPVMVKGISNRQYLTKDHTKDDKLLKIGFHGNLDYYPNIQATEFLINELYPRINGRDIQLVCCGRNPSNRLKNLFRKNSEIIFVDSPTDIFEVISGFDIYVAPMFSGSGMQNKLLEAAELGIPIITTSTGANPLEFSHEKHCLIANSVTQFIASILLLAEDEGLRLKLSMNAKNKVEETYSSEVIISKWQHIIKKNEL